MKLNAVQPARAYIGEAAIGALPDLPMPKACASEVSRSPWLNPYVELFACLSFPKMSDFFADFDLLGGPYSAFVGGSTLPPSWCAISCSRNRCRSPQPEAEPGRVALGSRRRPTRFGASLQKDGVGASARSSRPAGGPDGSRNSARLTNAARHQLVYCDAVVENQNALCRLPRLRLSRQAQDRTPAPKAPTPDPRRRSRG